MKRFYEIQGLLHTVVTDKSVFASKSALNPPGGLFGATLASTTTLAPAAPITYVSGTSAIAAITPPFTDFLGELLLIPTGAWTTTTGSSIANVITAVASVPVHAIYDGTYWYMK